MGHGQVTEYACGCMHHSHAGGIRFCAAHRRRYRFSVTPPVENTSRGKTIRFWLVAEIKP